MFNVFFALVAAILAFLGVSLGAAATTILDAPMSTRRLQIVFSIILLFVAFLLVSWIG